MANVAVNNNCSWFNNTATRDMESWPYGYATLKQAAENRKGWRNSGMISETCFTAEH